MTDLEQKINELPVSLLGRFVYQFLPYKRQIIMANIDRVYGEQLDRDQKKRLALSYYSHLFKSFKEAIQLRFMSEETLRNQVEIRGHEKMLEVVAQKKGVLVLTGHFGNWEVAPIGGVLNFKEFQGQFHFIRRTLSIKSIERSLFKQYYQVGLNVIPKKNSLDKVCAALEKNHAVIFVLDQHASLANRDGIAVEFFGTKAGTYRSLATLSRYTGVPVVPAAGYRLPNGKHVLEFYDPIPWKDYDTVSDSLYYNTLAYNQALERIILAHPEQWNWMHKRWKLKL
ncbi:lysophospholipid acyltransferase family protein [Legionella longbeachae]|uniref:Putative lipid A biosynthesis acyltransferase n=1 Tax=Legionella longbeachae serogroup 1 (strain NSW150) TaxID=661367 RepID=D3HPP2_LEGLN|nr:lysophospholipid acyltransferase family protein [Legionella longbeachae]VEE01378.1 lipid A biosynthesis acyltransferase [Legionella oakridgensis]HBD7396095.1 lysophospholipid acyltransferase family protein [Legionella pneumophila]ARB92257.1 lipid A biosynthesis acyltransferase [Legionella longbeachae]ARM34562.1 lysophospholipid acyltransferase family protein [Legionella longbeachae]EEZ96149.1 putative lipid A biosynthesis acyltransferase [Legionella longbeachae D-4968]